MAKYIGFSSNNQIRIISNTSFESKNLSILQVNEDISDEQLFCDYKIKNNQLVLKKQFGNTENQKIAFITNWKMPCGIATYAESLFPRIQKQFKDYKYFIEDNVQLEKISPEHFITCWKRGKETTQLVKEIKEYDPDIILINHEWGLFPHANIWLSLMSQLSDYRVIVIMHSVFHHKDKAICEAIMPEIVTHLEGGRNVLKEEKQISAKVSVIPHGCHELDQEKYWNLYNTPHTILQVGFGLKYKNFQDSIKATAILKQKYPDVFFTALFSESPHGRMEHQAYYNELIDLVRELDIESNIAIVRGFQSDEVINTYMKTNNIAVFPYVAQKGHEVFGSTGIARMAMSKGIPVVSSSGAHFSDLPTLKADSPVEIANIISELFESKQKIQDQISKQNEYVIKYSWDNVAEMYKKVFEE